MRFYFRYIFCTHKLDVLPLTETWLEQASGATALIVLAPSNFTFMSPTRTDKSHHLGTLCHLNTYVCPLIKCSPYILLVTLYLQASTALS